MAALAAPLFGFAVNWFVGVNTTSIPNAPYLWLAAGVFAWWLVDRKLAAADSGDRSVRDAGAGRRRGRRWLSSPPAAVLGWSWRPGRRRRTGSATTRGAWSSRCATRRVDAEVWPWTDGAPRASRRARAHRSRRGRAASTTRSCSAAGGSRPGLPLFFARLRRKRRRPRIAVMFHETYVDMRSASWALMGSWQRAQLLALQAASDVQLCSIQRWTERLRKTARGRPVHHLPVASNLPDARADRAAHATGAWTPIPTRWS